MASKSPLSTLSRWHRVRPKGATQLNKARILRSDWDDIGRLYSNRSVNRRDGRPTPDYRHLRDRQAQKIDQGTNQQKRGHGHPDNFFRTRELQLQQLMQFPAVSSEN